MADNTQTRAENTFPQQSAFSLQESAIIHAPVLLKKVIHYLDPKPNEHFIDATFGGGGHALEILRHTAPAGRVLGIEWDEELLAHSRTVIMKHSPALQQRLSLKRGNYRNMDRLAAQAKIAPIAGVLFDLGFSSWHIEHSKRGFSFKKDEILDMRFSRKDGEVPAYELLHQASQKTLEDIFRRFGEERYAQRVAREVVQRRTVQPIVGALQLAQLVDDIVPRRLRPRVKKRIHPATKVFQALRIAVNNELENVEQGLETAFRVVAREGRIVVLSFHGGEDQLVKHFFRKQEKGKAAVVLTKRPVVATEEEKRVNPRSRSAKLRAVRKL